ncbi:MAG: hypothetical protein DMD35_16810 [Gemmatimonadetes bacterium]|nr:MAG: hypothetical protein DMD35_16810 [Gemmatimonadota bacterium]
MSPTRPRGAAKRSSRSRNAATGKSARTSTTRTARQSTAGAARSAATRGAKGSRETADPSYPKTTRPSASERRPPQRKIDAAKRIQRKLDAVPDRVDIRDWLYQPRLTALPDQVVNCDLVTHILDQGQEGACTGFALAGVINYLLGMRRMPSRVSPYMLYRLARRYDEWPGEEYEGSSARGAMKGWVRHGVCDLDAWPDSKPKSDHLLEMVERDGRSVTVADLARATPGGAFYRINHRDVRDMHAALAEVGILYCTLMVHEGWDEPGPERVEVHYSVGVTDRVRQLPLITRKGRADSGHAIALVGYTRKGFIVQNSWGEDWGDGGFALLPYEDFLLHATDVWAAQLGVAVDVDVWSEGKADTTQGRQRASEAIPLSEIRPYVIDVGNNGRLVDPPGDGGLEEASHHAVPARRPERRSQRGAPSGGVPRRAAGERDLSAARDVGDGRHGVDQEHAGGSRRAAGRAVRCSGGLARAAARRAARGARSHDRADDGEARRRDVGGDEGERGARVGTSEPRWGDAAARQTRPERARGRGHERVGAARRRAQCGEHLRGASASAAALGEDPAGIGAVHGAGDSRRRVQVARLPAHHGAPLPSADSLHPERRRRAGRHGRPVRQIAALSGEQRVRGTTGDAAARDAAIHQPDREGGGTHRRRRHRGVVRGQHRRTATTGDRRRRLEQGQHEPEPEPWWVRQRQGHAELHSAAHPR